MVQKYTYGQNVTVQTYACWLYVHVRLMKVDAKDVIVCKMVAASWACGRTFTAFHSLSAQKPCDNVSQDICQPPQPQAQGMFTIETSYKLFYIELVRKLGFFHEPW